MKTILFLLLTGLVSHAALLNKFNDSGWLEIKPGGAGPAITTTISISCWITIKTNYAPNTVLGVVLDKGRTTATPSDSNYAIRIFTNKFQFQYMVSGAFHRWVPDPDVPAVGVPVHLAVTYTYGTGSSIKFYINGLSVSGAWRQGDGNSAVIANDRPLWYGQESVGNVFRGIINEVGIWSTILSDAQVKALTCRVKGMPLQVAPASLVLYSPLDDQPAGLATTDVAFKGLGSFLGRGSIEGFGSMSAWYEHINSYYPNE